VALEVLEELGVDAQRALSVWTKSDLAPSRRPRGGLIVSGRTGAGIEALEEAILLHARPEREQLWLRVPYAEGRAIAAVRARFRVLEEEDLGDALLLRVAGERKNAAPFREFLVETPALRASGS
jgi:50S ribosomal subunit-associated GTPase HflX